LNYEVKFELNILNVIVNQSNLQYHPKILGATQIPKKEGKEKMNLKVEKLLAPTIALCQNR
jgi:hypothetical protein